MIKKHILKKFVITSAIIFSVFLMCLFPSSKLSNVKQELEYEDLNVNHEHIYLLDKYNYLARTSVVVYSEDIEQKAKELLYTLIKESSNENKIPSGFKSIIPSNTEIKNIEYKNNIIKVDFNSALLDVNEQMEEKVIEAIIYTLTSIDNVDKVIIYVDGKILTKLPKTKINLPSILDRNYGINKKYNLSSYKDINKVTIYYLNEYNDKYYYVPVTKYVNDNKDKLDIIIDELQGSDNSLISFLNNNTILLNKQINGKKATLTFNDEIFDDKDNRSIKEEVKNSISLSVKENYDIDEVTIKNKDTEICKTVVKSIE